MSPAVREWLERVLAVPEDERPSILETLPPQIREEILDLLRFDNKTGSRVIDSMIGNAAKVFAADALTGKQLSPGTLLGPYEIVEVLGAGGMGMVYKARDTRLGRDVAVKVSRAEFSERFQVEARAVAVLSHPHICTLHDVGPNYLVMEFIEGAPLRGPLPLDQALKYAAQICDALNAAHKKNITHRDLKPGNILVTKTGIKLLDFGLAKFSKTKEPFKDATLTMAFTGRSEIVGTIYYMSPEQLQAQATDQQIDGRSDIFSFGLVLYEMITGKRAFEGVSAASVIAAIIQRPAPSIADVAPPALDRLLKKCLAKDREDRWHSARDLKDEIEWIATRPAIEATSVTAPSRSWLGWVAAAFAAGAALAVMATLSWLWRPATDPARVVRFQIVPKEASAASRGGAFALSPDGSKLVFIATGSDGISRLWLRPMDALEAHALPEGEVKPVPFWSPDSRFVLYTAGGKFKKVDVAGGPPITLCDMSNKVVLGGSVNRDRVIIFGINQGFIQRIAWSGGTPSAVTAFNPARKDIFHGYPVFLPDGRHFLYLVHSEATENNGIYLGALDSKPEQQAPRRLVATDIGAGFVPFKDGDGGAILFERDGTVFAQSFDLRRLETVGEPVPIAEQVRSFLGLGFFSASNEGTLVYLSNNNGAGNAGLSWHDRRGNRLVVVGEHPYSGLALSPDGETVAAVRADASSSDIWLLSSAHGDDTPLTFDSAIDGSPVWSPDGKYIAYAATRPGDFSLHRRAASPGAGQDKLLLKWHQRLNPTDWSRDGRYLLYHDHLEGNRDLLVLPLDAAKDTPGGEPQRFLHTPFDEGNGKFSPDGHWVAYESNESGRSEIYVRPFPKVEGDSGKKISHGGGRQPRWRDDRELFYLAPDGGVMAVSVSRRGTALEFGRPSILFKAPTSQGWDVSADAKRFLFPIPVGDTAQLPFTVIQNWMLLLKK